MSNREELYYIWNGQYAYNGFVWWAENKNGYTAYLEKAGKYTRDEAYSITKNRESDLAIPVYVIEESKAKFTITDSQFIDKIQFLNFEKLEPPQPAPGRFVPEEEIQKLREAFSVTKSYMRLDGAVHDFLQAIEKGGNQNE